MRSDPSQIQNRLPMLFLFVSSYRTSCVLPVDDHLELSRPSSSHVHWPSIAKSDTAANDAIHEPKSDQSDREPHEEEANPKCRDDEDPTEGYPEQSKPERSDLPAKVRFQPGAASLALLDVVQNDRNDRRPAVRNAPTTVAVPMMPVSRLNACRAYTTFVQVTSESTSSPQSHVLWSMLRRAGSYVQHNYHLQSNAIPPVPSTHDAAHIGRSEA